MGEPASHASRTSHGCESCEPTWRAMRVNMRLTQLLKANRFKMGAQTKYTLFFIRMLFFRPRLNILIFLPILG